MTNVPLMGCFRREFNFILRIHHHIVAQTVMSKKGKYENGHLISENSRPEVYTEEHAKLVGDAKMEWTLCDMEKMARKCMIKSVERLVINAGRKHLVIARTASSNATWFKANFVGVVCK